MRIITAAFLIMLAVAGCSSKAAAPQRESTTPRPSALTGDGYVRFAAAITGPAIRITPDGPGCSIPIRGDDPLDLHTKVTLTGHQPGGATGTVEFEAESVLGYGRIQSTGKCEFLVVMEFPVPATQPSGYTLSISDRGGCQNYWPITTDQMMSGQRAQLTLSGDC
jgi:hypothetical protein